ncbi:MULTISPECIES: FUSC family protein [Providencia]|uniref:FUSC family protein n=1 Tax=Providencia stuartii TaxID=588 RepID=A0ABD5L906_PROST|nr:MULTISPECIES: FUSC family protein [Providencia]ELR5044561.1 FUSC family protein [Providencia rettgeri]ELR5291145.1 FUSC family protein [Providencia stuartii]MCR4180126.1 FUSC family protein [Providencia vermicola]URE77052.1 FUSC family protein [Providencia stuartii]
MSISLHQIRSALLLSLWVIAPWIFGIFYGQAMFGTLMSFGAYLLVVSYPKLPKKNPIPVLLQGAGILSVFAIIGINVTLGSLLFFIYAALGALIQGYAELRATYLRLPIALGVLAYFLSIGQIPSQGSLFYSCAFTLGTCWGVIISYLQLPRNEAPASATHIDLRSPAVQRFSIAMVLVALIGSVLATLLPSSHPCWLPAAGLRVMKSERMATWARLKQRGIGTLLGAAVGGLLLGFYENQLLHVSLVGLLLFAMLIIGAKRYGYWTFCLTAIALTFNITATAGPIILAFDRVLLTICALIIAITILLVLPKSTK